MNQHLDIDPAEFITHRSLSQGTDTNYLKYCATEAVHELFSEKLWPHAPSDVHRGRVLVSGYSDYTVCEQSENHPNDDLAKISSRLDWRKAMANRQNYSQMSIGPCCNREKCLPSNRYSLKIDSWTCATFDDLPPAIRMWFAANLNAEHPRMRFLPFGLNDHGPGLGLLPSFRERKKTGLLYVNFQNNTLERIHLKRFFRDCPWVTFREEANIPVDQYLEEVATHKFILSPFGNGADCYRNYEAMYLGSIPIVPTSIFGNHMEGTGFPMLQADDYRSLTPSLLMAVHENFCERSDGFRWDVLRVSWWQQQIAEAVASLQC